MTDPARNPLSDEITMEPDKEYTITLTGIEVGMVAGVLLHAADQAREQDFDEGFDLLTDLAVKIIQQVDPDGWAATERKAAEL